MPTGRASRPEGCPALPASLHRVLLDAHFGRRRLRRSLRARLLLCAHRLELPNQLHRLGHPTGGKLGVQLLAVVGYLKRIDRLQRLRDHVQSERAADREHRIIVHLKDRARRRPPNRSRRLLSEEVAESHQRLRRPHGTDGVLHAHRRCVIAALNGHAGERRLERESALPEGARRLSGAAELDPNRRVVPLDCRPRDDCKR
mmetsp:Transcript_7736/g.25480  ORF Transcript_7736/g.25480 Transcript_7736/m.25480 type:complete len:201 (-) Transcript_7736:109-711(-)